MSEQTAQLKPVYIPSRWVALARHWKKLNDEGEELWKLPRCKTKARVRWHQAQRVAGQLAEAVLISAGPEPASPHE